MNKNYILIILLFTPSAFIMAMDDYDVRTEPDFYFYIPPSEKVGRLENQNGELLLAIKPTFNPQVPQDEQVLNRVYIYDKNGQTKTNLKVSDRPNLNLAVSPNGTYFATNTQRDKEDPGGLVHLYASDGAHMESFPTPAEIYPRTSLGFGFNNSAVIFSGTGLPQGNITTGNVILGHAELLAAYGFDYVYIEPNYGIGYNVDLQEKAQRAIVWRFSFQSKKFFDPFTVACQKYAISEMGSIFAAQTKGKVNFYSGEELYDSISIPRDQVWMMKFFGNKFFAVGGKKLRIYDMDNLNAQPQVITNDNGLYFVDATTNREFSEVYSISQTSLESKKPYVGLLAAYKLLNSSKKQINTHETPEELWKAFEELHNS